MKWHNVKLILRRELKDQFRDRRTLFTVLVLPLLLYPLMGMALLQISQFAKQHSSRIWIAGQENLPSDPALFVDGQFNPALFGTDESDQSELLFAEPDDKVFQFFKRIAGVESDEQTQQATTKVAQLLLNQHRADLAVIIPSKIDLPDLSDEFDEAAAVPKILVFQNSAQDKSNMAAERLQQAIMNWQGLITGEMLKAKAIDTNHLKSFRMESTDVADREWKQAATWSKILPFIVMIWSLTGAFYPAVDLCAGEKERGTFETLLSSPALRSEIAIGKLLTVITFSILTSLLNLLSMGFTGLFVVSRLGAQLGANATQIAPLGLPPIYSFFWLLLALIPIAALFSAVALAAASFAKSSKEGQYYLVPLMMISMPLMMLPMMPAAKLDFGSSLIPVSGLMLMLRGLIEGQYKEVAPFAGPVVAVTLVCCWLAIRWVIVQFSSESVIFRPSERFSVGVWLKKSVQERHDFPLVGHALLCGILILVLKFFMSLGASVPDNWWQFSKQTVIALIAAVAIPAVMMAMFLTRKPAESLKLIPCRIPVACAAILAAILLHPCAMWLTNLVMAIYPPTADLGMLEGFMLSIFADAPGLWALILVLAVAPAIFEELAFRGFILSGLQSCNSNFKAVLISSLLFGIAHSILQQSIVTFFLGCLLGYIAVKTSSVIPCILYHLVHNGITTTISMVNEQSFNQFPLLKYFLVQSAEGGYEYAVWPAVMMVASGIFVVIWLGRNAMGSPKDGDAVSTNLRTTFESYVAKISSKS